MQRISPRLIGGSGNAAQAAGTREASGMSQSSVLMELASGLDYLINQLAKGEESRHEMEAERDQLRHDLAALESRIGDMQTDASKLREAADEQDGVIAEQQKALYLSLELMRRLESEIGTLRSKVETIEAQTAAVPDPSLPNALAEKDALLSTRDARIAELEAKIQQESESLALRIQELEKDTAAKDQELVRLREELDQAQKESGQTSNGADIRALELQRDQARAEAATARADLSIQSAELESKEELIAALERALEQQHGSLRSLEERLGVYAARLQEIRMYRLTEGDSESGSQEGGLFSAFRALFSPSKRKAAQAGPPADQETDVDHESTGANG